MPKNGTGEESINKGFIKVQVANPPESYVSFDQDSITGYVVDLSTINYTKLKSGRDYLTMMKGDTVTFGEEDAYIYDASGTVYYLKGYQFEDGQVVYSEKGNEVKEGPEIEVISTTNGNVKLKVTPKYGGSITSVIVGNKIATSTDGTNFETFLTSNGSYIVIATEEGGSSRRITISVQGISESLAEGLPILQDVYLNSREMYTKNNLATLVVEAENATYMSISQNVLSIPTATDLARWREYSRESTLTLNEGTNKIYVWAKNATNGVTDYKLAEITLDTKAPTREAPSYVMDGYKILMTCNQLDSNEMRVEYGYKNEFATDFTWQESQIIVDVEPGVKYQLKTKATDMAGNSSESRITETNEVLEIPSDIQITSYPDNTWTKRVNVNITYPGTYGVEPYENLYRIDGGEWHTVNSNNITMTLISNSKIEAVVSAKINGVDTKMGEIKEYIINNIDRVEPSIYDVYEKEEYVQAGYDLTFKIRDEESGIIAWTVNESEIEPTNWNHNMEATNEVVNCSHFIERNGTYYIWAKDKSGIASNVKVVVDKIDLTNPIINSYNISYGTGVATLTVNTIDENCGINGYAFVKGQNETPSESDWISVEKTTTTQTFTKEVSENDYYSIFVRDVSGRISNMQKYVKTKYEVTYDYHINNGETISLTENTKLVGCNSNVDLTPTSTREYSSFTGWNTDPSAEVALESLRLGDETTGQEDITIYAIFKYEDTINFAKSTNNKVYELNLTITKEIPFTTLQYSFDNNTWTNYSAPIYIDRNRTVYARTIYQNKTIKSSSITIDNICENHNYRAATCTENSICTICSKYNGPALGHNASEATCTAASVCSRCNATVASALGHNGSTATCTAASVCSRCNATVASALGHNGSTATCTSPSVCSRCNVTLANALGHNGSTATCTAASVCSRCNATVASALGHDAPNATCTAASVCSRCNVTLENALGHSGSTATCTSPSVCSRCNETVASALGHNWGAYTTVKEATCTSTGSQSRTCSRCNDKSSRTIDELGHYYAEKNTGSDYLAAAAACRTPATYYYKCTRCTSRGTSTFEHGNFKGHVFGTFTVMPGRLKVAATCTTNAVYWLTCNVCKTSAANGNTMWDTYVANTDYGTGTFEDPNTALGHKWDSATCTKAKTCTRNGCNATSGNALGHSYSNNSWVYHNASQHKKKCDRCTNYTYKSHSFQVFGDGTTSTCVVCGCIK